MKRQRSRRGSVLLFAVFLMIVMLAIVALAVDIGYLRVVNAELQRSADAAAIAATRVLLDERQLPGTGVSDYAAVRTAAARYAAANLVAQAAPGLAGQDTTLGRLAYPFSTATLDPDSSAGFNAVRVAVRRTGQQNGEVTLFFARIFGLNSSAQQAEATAAFVDGVRGFRRPAEASGTAANVMILPFALDKTTWDALKAGGGSDVWKYHADNGSVTPACDGVREVNLYPQGTGSPGNRGTVDIGSSNNSTADISRQILYGVTEADLACHGGKLEFDAAGKLYLNGDTGISAGVKDELAAIRGQGRIIPVFSAVSGNGNNAQYTIVEWAGVRIMSVKLTGNPKEVIVQPARVMAKGGIPAAAGGGTSSSFVYSPVILVK